jgi:hypothetical protein
VSGRTFEWVSGVRLTAGLSSGLGNFSGLGAPERLDGQKIDPGSA